MTQDRLIEAIGRIERALSRIERTDLSVRNASSNMQSDKDLDLIARHENLKAETAAAIHEIDMLIAFGAH